MFHNLQAIPSSDGTHIGQEIVVYWYDPDEDLWAWRNYCPLDSQFNGNFISNKIGIPIKIDGGETLYPNYDVPGYVYYRDVGGYLWADFDFFYGNKWYYSKGIGIGTEENIYNLLDRPGGYIEFIPDRTNCAFTGDEFWETPQGGYYGILASPTLKPRGSALQNNLPDKVITGQPIIGWKCENTISGLNAGIYSPAFGATGRNRYLGWIKYDEISWTLLQGTYNGVSTFRHTDGRYLWRRTTPRYQWIISDVIGTANPTVGYWLNSTYVSGNYTKGIYTRVFEQPVPVPNPLRTPPSPTTYLVGMEQFEQFEDTGAKCNGETVLFSTLGRYLWKSNVINKWVISFQTGVIDNHVGYWVSNSVTEKFNIVFESVAGSVPPIPDSYLLGINTSYLGTNYRKTSSIEHEPPPQFPVAVIALYCQ